MHTLSAAAVPIAGLSIVAAATAPHLPLGPCFDDSGDLQTAAALLGIGHPPGYPMFVAAWHAAARLTGASPAVVVSASAWIAGLAALLLAVRVLARLGASAVTATGAMLLLALHPLIRLNLLVPDVYTLCLLLPACAAWLLLDRQPGIAAASAADAARAPTPSVRPESAAIPSSPPGDPGRESGSPARLVAACLLLGIAVASRPTCALLLSGFIPAGRRCLHGVHASRPSRIALFAAVTAALIAPAVASFAVVIALDRPDSPYNYVEASARSDVELPPVSDGLGARVRRAAWLLSGATYREHLSLRPGDALERARFALHHVAPAPAWLLWLLIGAIGIARIAREAPARGWLLTGLALGNVAFLLLYHVTGQAADALPLLWAIGIGVGRSAAWLAELLPQTRWDRVYAVAAACVALGAVRTLTRYPAYLHDVDASRFLRQVDVAGLPRESCILATWRECTPLAYAALVDSHRADLRIVNEHFERWPDRIREELSHGAGAPTYAVREPPADASYRVSEARGMWLVERVTRSP